MDNNLKFLNAINILAVAKIGALQNIHDYFKNDWERAWNFDLSGFLPREKDKTGKLVDVDYDILKIKIDPEKEWIKLKNQKIDVITINDDDYPFPLRHIADPPFLLYVRGSKKSWDSPAGESCFGVVGTRALSEYGRRSTAHIALDIARAGFVIVSGLAAGIDTLAHKAALDAGAVTIAVLGCGVDDRTIFPQQNLGLAKKIIENGGAVISEYAVGMHGNKFTFPQRNRIISGLSKGVLIVEADEQSGAMITAKCALDQNRDVFAIPGSIFARTSKGTNNIIKKGAKLVTCAEDILEEYEIYLKSKKSNLKTKADNLTEEKILTILSNEPITTDEIIRKTGFDTAQVNATLMIMELNKKIKNLGSNKFVVNA